MGINSNREVFPARENITAGTGDAGKTGTKKQFHTTAKTQACLIRDSWITK